MKALSDIIRHLNKTGLTAKDLAKMTSISQKTIEGWRDKNTMPGAEALFTFCEAVKITMEEAVKGPAGIEYVRALLREPGMLYEPPERIKDIVDNLNTISDDLLPIIRATVDSAAQKSRGQEAVSPMESDSGDPGTGEGGHDRKRA